MISPPAGYTNDGSQQITIGECTNEGPRLSESPDGVYAMITGVESTRVKALSTKFIVNPRSCYESAKVEEKTIAFVGGELYRKNDRPIMFGVHNLVTGTHQATEPIYASGYRVFQTGHPENSYDERIHIGKGRSDSDGGDYCGHSCMKLSIWEQIDVLADAECVL